MLRTALPNNDGYLKPSTVSTLWTPNEITTGKVSKSYPEDSYALGWTIHPVSYIL